MTEQERIDYETFKERTWGSWEVLEDRPGLYKVKRLEIYPDKSISLQSHNLRAETWVIVQGKGRVIKGDITFTVNAGDHFHVPKMMKHKITNIGTDLLIAIETQTGEKCIEEDIVRYD